MNFNQVILIGKVGKIEKLENITVISVATSRKEYEEYVTDWHSVSFSNKMSDWINIQKGDEVMIVGTLQYKEKNKVKYTNIFAKTVKVNKKNTESVAKGNYEENLNNEVEADETPF